MAKLLEGCPVINFADKRSCKILSCFGCNFVFEKDTRSYDCFDLSKLKLERDEYKYDYNYLSVSFVAGEPECLLLVRFP